MNVNPYASLDDPLERCEAFEAKRPAPRAVYLEEGDFRSVLAGIADEIVEDASRADHARDLNAVPWRTTDSSL